MYLSIITRPIIIVILLSSDRIENYSHTRHKQISNINVKQNENVTRKLAVTVKRNAVRETIQLHLFS